MRKKSLIFLFIMIIIGSVIFVYFYQNRSTVTIKQLEILDVDKADEMEAQKQKIIGNNKFMHFSLDDFIDPFEDISKNNCQSIFENKTFKQLKELHDKFGIVVSLYVFYEKEDFNLSQTSDEYAAEFRENSDWLKFGFHAYNYETNYESVSSQKASDDYDKVINELIRITGSEKSIDTVIRLHYFASNDNNVDAMRERNHGIKGFLGADDKRRSYALNDKKNSYLYKYDYIQHDKLDYFKTDIRVESVENISSALKDLDGNTLNETKDILVIFTHEELFNQNDIQNKVEKYISFTASNGYDFAFPMDRIK